MTDLDLAPQILALVGGASNVERLTHCMSRLRFVLRDPAVPDDAALTALPDVVLVVRQSGQLQIAVRAGVITLHDDVAALLVG